MDKPTPVLTAAIFELFDEDNRDLMDIAALTKAIEKNLNREERVKLAVVNRRYEEFERERDKMRIVLTQEKAKATIPEHEAQYLIHCLAVREQQSETIRGLIAGYTEILRDHLARTGKVI